jgi:hypothetical protein
MYQNVNSNHDGQDDERPYESNNTEQASALRQQVQHDGGEQRQQDR